MWPFKKAVEETLEVLEKGIINDADPENPIGTIRAEAYTDYTWRIEIKVEEIDNSRYILYKKPPSPYRNEYLIWDRKRIFKYHPYHKDNEIGFASAEAALDNYRKFKAWINQKAVNLNE